MADPAGIYRVGVPTLAERITDYRHTLETEIERQQGKGKHDRVKALEWVLADLAEILEVHAL